MEIENNEAEGKNKGTEPEKHEMEVESDGLKKYEFELESESKNKKKLVLVGLSFFLVLSAGFLVAVLWQKEAAETRIVKQTRQIEHKQVVDNDLNLDDTDLKMSKSDFKPGERESQLMRGDIINLDDQELVIKTGQGDKTFLFTEKSIMTTQDKNSIVKISLKELSTGDKVMVNCNEKAEIVMLEKF